MAVKVKSTLIKFWHLNRMGRIEGPPLAALLLLAGVVLNNEHISFSIFMAALAMGALCMNYVYLVNGVTDIKEDSINSPNRPLARGDVNEREAWIYVHSLFFFTCIYPFFLHDTWFQRSIVWVILAMGFFYSLPPVRFKRFPPLATIYLVINFNLPIILGYKMSSQVDSNHFPPYILSTVALFLANMPLKDYGDRKGDIKVGMGNWVSLLGGASRLLGLSTWLSILGSVVCFFYLPEFNSQAVRWVYVGLPLIPALNIALHKILGWDMDQMFTRGVRSLIAICIALVIFY